MKAAEFIERVGRSDYGPSHRLNSLAAELVEAGVLEADDNPQPRRVEVEGVEVYLDADNDLEVVVDDEHKFYLYGEEARNAARIARALLAWVAAGEPQERPQAAPPKGETWRERSGGVEFLVTRDKGGAAGGRQLCFRDHSDEPLVAFGDRQAGGHPWIEDDSYRVISRAALAELAAHFCPPQAQAAPGPTQGTWERPFIWKRRTESGGTEEVPVWLEGNRLGDGSFSLCAGGGACYNLIHFFAGSERPERAWSAVDYPGPKDFRGRALFKGDDLPQPAAQPQPQPEAGEVVLRLTREEARAVAILCSNVCPSGSTLADAAVEVTEKLADHLPDVDDPANDLGITFQD